jgi:hypothetical protein
MNRTLICIVCVGLLAIATPTIAQSQTENPAAVPIAAQLAIQAYQWWLSKQPFEVQRWESGAILLAYADELRSQCVPETDVVRTMTSRIPRAPIVSENQPV